ncbi:zinc finger, C3HC4 type (RING finger) protein (macronuclear) [Tetrahymena thermophila SB210]|uniref:Zinc finger, C3HC4 type (RING finger) protein n=1 Tax=Tetrahymena thermophila (strain SB210) TaxID=312017 RepID=Q23MD5_TETTS|nr:zinc finger, C3HC4 type (RING finger) protein [Tetrahymena thermophila SB210]EAR97704.3 zinc finger, C3HC4 type (RING finger) protein [Tetrahymena thermophila SB210]|eukprot:XP_001017949.3 zinc finger, C3HC4 type (RING finger) protein [Tetrahymena thermophila SB210]
MMGIDFKIFESCLNIILSGIYLYLAIQQWMHSTQSENRVMVCIFITLLLGFQQSLILFRTILSNSRRYDFQITIMYLIIHLINCSEIQDQSVFSIDFHLTSQIAFIQYSFIFFYSILLVNLVYYTIIAVCLLVVALISLIQIWRSSDSIVNREGLTSQEFESLPSHVVNAKESKDMKLSFESGFHNPQLNDCAICLQTFEENEVMIEIVQCKHLFHSECIKVWFKNSVLCPYCRNDVRKALQKLKREKHQLQHAGHSILDKIVDQAEPSFQLEEFIEENDLRNQEVIQ